MPTTFLPGGLVVICALVVAGCAPPTTTQRLVGRWKGAPEVKEAVDDMVQSAAQGQEVNQLAQGAARFLGNALAKATMSVEIDLRPSGVVFLRGNTELLGVPPDSEGEWSVVSASEDVAHVEFDIDNKTYTAKIILRDADEFTLKMEPPGAAVAGTPAGSPAATPAIETPVEKPVATIRDEDKDFEDDDPPAKATPVKPVPVPIQAAPPPVKPAAAATEKKPPESILFKRSSG